MHGLAHQTWAQHIPSESNEYQGEYKAPFLNAFSNYNTPNTLRAALKEGREEVKRMEMTHFISFLTLSLHFLISYLQLTIHSHLQKMGHRDKENQRWEKGKWKPYKIITINAKIGKKMHNKPGIFFYFQFFGTQIP